MPRGTWMQKVEKKSCTLFISVQKWSELWPAKRWMYMSQIQQLLSGWPASGTNTETCSYPYPTGWPRFFNTGKCLHPLSSPKLFSIPGREGPWCCSFKGGSFLHASVERSSTVRFMCGNRRELVDDVKEDSTCHYISDVTVPELCHHELFWAEVTKKQVVECLPVWKRVLINNFNDDDDDDNN